jgi:hypothetical protein
MKSKFLFPAIFVAGLMMLNFSAYQVYGQASENEPTKQQIAQYTCAMHTEVVKEQSGKCPICGMKLVEKKDISKGDMQQANDSTMMKPCDKKVMHDSIPMKKEHMMEDSPMMKNGQIMQDSTSMKHEHMEM